MAKLRVLAFAVVALLIGSIPGPAQSTEGCRFRVAAIRAEIATKVDRSQLEQDLEAADRLCRSGEVGKAVAMLSDIVARLRAG